MCEEPGGDTVTSEGQCQLGAPALSQRWGPSLAPAVTSECAVAAPVQVSTACARLGHASRKGLQSRRWPWQPGSRKHFPEAVVGFPKDQLQDHMAHQVTGHAVVVFMQMECRLVATMKAHAVGLGAGPSLACFCHEVSYTLGLGEPRNVEINLRGWSCRDLRCTVSGEEVAVSTRSLEAPVSGGQAGRACHTPCLRGALGPMGSCNQEMQGQRGEVTETVF